MKLFVVAGDGNGGGLQRPFVGVDVTNGNLLADPELGFLRRGNLEHFDLVFGGLNGEGITSAFNGGNGATEGSRLMAAMHDVGLAEGCGEGEEAEGNKKVFHTW